GGQRAARRRLEAAAAEWRRVDRAPDALFGARQLAETASLDEDLLSPEELSFLAASRAAARRARLGRWGILLSVPVVIAGGAGAWRWKAQRDLDGVIAGHLERARADLSVGRAAKVIAAERRRQAFTLFDAVGEGDAALMDQRLAEAERTWSSALDEQKRAEA